jgi:hypothetical protein
MPGSLKPPGRDDAYLVFGLELPVHLDVGGWKTHAERFFSTRLSIAPDVRFDAGFPWWNTALVAIEPLGAQTWSGGARACWGRGRNDDDARKAIRAEAKTGLAGLAALAGRSKLVWLVAFEGPPDEDVVALRIAAILAGVSLGPIVTPSGEIFGPKTARQRLGV